MVVVGQWKHIMDRFVYLVCNDLGSCNRDALEGRVGELLLCSDRCDLCLVISSAVVGDFERF